MTVTITDDIDGSKDATEIAFSFDGTDYTIDLSNKNRKAMEKALKPYLDAATKTGKTGSTKRRKTTATTGRKDMTDIRAWAQSNGIDVSDRGRVPASVIEQYDAAN